MLGRQSVKVTYAHKRRRLQNASKKLLSSPLEVLPPDVDDLTRTQMARRMLKRSRRVALAEQLEDKNVDHIGEHLAKRTKHTKERISNLELTEVPFDAVPQEDLAFQTPFPSSKSANDSAVAIPLVSEQLSPVPVARRVMSRTSSRNLKENGPSSQILASPFSSRPGSAAPSPKHKGRRRSSRRVSRITLHTKPRIFSGVFKENTRCVSRKDSTVSLKDTNGEPSTRRFKHRRFPSSPSIAYMRSQFPQESWIAPPMVSSRTFDDDDELQFSGGSGHSNASFYADQPQSCSTPAAARLRKLSDLRGHPVRTDSLFGSSSLCTGASGPDTEMVDDTDPLRRQTIHLSGNSIFSSSDEFTIGSIPFVRDGGTTIERGKVTSRDESSARVTRQVTARRETVDESQPGQSLAGSFIAEYAIPLPDSDHSPASTSPAKMRGSEGVLKSSVGQRFLGLPGTSPARGGNIVISGSPGVPKSVVGVRLLSLPATSPARGECLIRTSRNPGPSKLSVGGQPVGSPGTSLARGDNLVVRTSRNPVTLTPPASPLNATATCPSSPASDMVLELQSMNICGDPDPHSDGETRPFASSVLQTRSHSLQNVPAELTTKKLVKRRPARNRADTIRVSDFAKSGVLSRVAPGLANSPVPNVRRTRSGTVVGPDSKLAAKGARLPTQASKGASTSRLAAVQSGSESESDDELLLKGFWVEDIEYLGLAVPQGREEVEADELNLGYEPSPSRRLGLRRR